jgi:hypothetical protein
MKTHAHDSACMKKDLEYGIDLHYITIFTWSVDTLVELFTRSSYIVFVWRTEEKKLKFIDRNSKDILLIYTLFVYISC